MMLQFISSITISLSFQAQPLCFQWFSDILFLLRKPYSYDFVTLDMKMLPKKKLIMLHLIMMFYIL